MAKVLILDGHCSAALAFVRSLGRAGHFVIVGAEKRFFTPATSSRYCSKSFYYPSPVNGADKFLTIIKDVVDREGVDVVFPMTDITVWPLSFQREKFSAVKIAVPAPEVIDLVSDKFKTIELAEKLGVPVPPAMIINSQDDLTCLLAKDWPYPFVIKDRFSMRWENGKGVAGGVDFTYGRAELVKKVEEKLLTTKDIVVQQFTAGIGVGFACFAVDGEIFWPFQWERIREKDPRGSGSSARKSQAIDSGVFEYSKKLVIASGFQGIVMVEFKKNPDSGELFLMEINGRPWGSLQLPIHAGYNYPKAVVDWLLSGKIPDQRLDYKKNITCRWLVADLIHLENVKGGSPEGWPIPYPNLARSCFDVLIPWYPGLRYDHFSWSDLRPGFAELFHWVKGRFA